METRGGIKSPFPGGVAVPSEIATFCPAGKFGKNEVNNSK